MFPIPILPPPADEIVADFAEKICNIQPGFIEGIYLTGSLPLNDFYSNKSDIDFLVFCRELPDEKMAMQLKQIHKTIENKYQKPDLSGSYLTFESILTGEPESKRVLSYHEKKMRFQNFEMAPVSLSELKTNAITVVGAQANTLPIYIRPQKLNEFLYENINTYWKKWIKQYSSFFHRKIILLAFPRFTEWSVLGIARQYYTLQTGKITSKTEAGQYCLQHLPEKYHPIIKEAIEIRKDNRTYPFVKSYAIRPSFKRLMQTIECIHYLVATFNKAYHETCNDAVENKE